MPSRLTRAAAEAATRLWPVELRGQERHAGATPHEVVATHGVTRLLHYAPAEGARRRTPIVFVYSLINRYYILDFLPGRSLVAFLAARGHPCYVIDWGSAGPGERHKTFGDYAVGLIGHHVDAARAHGDAGDVVLYGYCMGGTLALCHAALRPRHIRALVAMATPVDFHDGGLLSTWTREHFFDVDALVDAWGNVPTWLMEGGFRMLSPLGSLSKWRDLWENRDREGFVDTWRALERWAGDNVPFPGEVYRQYIRDCYQRNALCRGEMSLNAERVDLTSLQMPLYVATARNDHIVPAASSCALTTLVSSIDVTHEEFPTGHIGLSTSSKAPREFWPAIARWIEAHAC